MPGREMLVADQQPSAPSVGAGGGSSAELAVPKTRREKLKDAGFPSYPWLSKGEWALLDGGDYSPEEWNAHFALKGVKFADDKRFARLVIPSEKFPAELANEGRIRWGSVNVRVYANSGASEKDGGSGDRLLCDPVCAGGETPGVFGMAHRHGPVRSCMWGTRARAEVEVVRHLPPAVVEDYCAEAFQRALELKEKENSIIAEAKKMARQTVRESFRWSSPVAYAARIKRDAEADLLTLREKLLEGEDVHEKVLEVEAFVNSLRTF